MARPREFDQDEVLDAAIGCFWSQGYEATSVRDLASRMGITGASLYNAFGDKRSLFRMALERYLDQNMRAFIAHSRAAQSPLIAIQGLILETIERSVTDPESRGCFLVNSALEVAPHDPEFRQLVQAAMAELEGFFREQVELGQRQGVISCRHSGEDLARLLLGILLAIRVASRARPERAFLESMALPLRTLLTV